MMSPTFPRADAWVSRRGHRLSRLGAEQQQPVSRPGAGHSSAAPRSTANTLERSPVRGLTQAAISGVGSLATLIFSRFSTGV